MPVKVPEKAKLKKAKKTQLRILLYCSFKKAQFSNYAECYASIRCNKPLHVGIAVSVAMESYKFVS